MSEFEKINAVLPNFTARVEDPPSSEADQTRVKNTLSNLFGQSAQFLEPILFRSGKLVIFVTAPVWGTHIRHRRETLLKQLGNHSINITEVRVKVVPPSPSSSPPKPPEVSTPVGAGTLNTISLTSLSVKNERLKSALNQLRERLSQSP